MSRKKPDVTKLLEKVEVGRKLPTPVKGVTLLEQGVLAVIARDHTQAQAEAALGALRSAYPDWNEARVAQAQELAGHLGDAKKGGRAGSDAWIPTACAVKSYLQDVFQKTHGLDIEFFADDLATASKLVTQMPELGLFDGSYLLWIAANRTMPVHTALIRVLDRLGLITRTTSIKKARSAIEPLAPRGRELEFAAIFGHVADRWCDARKPICHECPLVDDCAFGIKAFKEWQVQQARLAAQREKAEKQRLLLEKREEERRVREEKRQQKRAAQLEAKLERERARKEKADEKRRAAQAAKEARRKAAEKKKQEAEKKRLAAKKQKEALAAKKKDAERKKAAAKKKQAARGKTAAKKKTAKKAAKKKTAKKSTAKKASAKKKTTRKSTKKKAVSRVAKKSAKKTKKKVTRKPAAKRTTKKSSGTTKRKTARKSTRRR